MAEEKLDETIVGGLIVKGDQVVNAAGEALAGWSVVNGEAVQDKPQKAPKAEKTDGTDASNGAPA